MELREKIAQQIFAICDNVFAQEVFAENAVGQILDIPEIKEALETAANLRANQERQARLRGGGSMVWSASHARIEPKA